MASIAAKPPNERDESEKKFFVLFLKLRVPFFSSFNRRTLRIIIERISVQFLRRDQYLTQFERQADFLYVMIQGQLAEFYEMHQA